MERVRDCLILGSGVGSLTCGTLLAQHGWRVLLLSDALPGEAFTLSWNGWRLDRWPECLWGLEEGGVLQRALTAAQVQPEAIRLDPGVQALLPGHRVGCYPPGPQWERELQREFPRSAKRAIACLEELSRIHRVIQVKIEAELSGKRAWRPSPTIAREPLERFLARFSLDPPLCRMVQGLAAACFAVEPAATTVAMAASLFGHIRQGLFALRGGIGGLVEQLSSRFQALGGEIRTGQPQETRTRWGRIHGLTILDGEEVRCRHLVIEPGPVSTWGSLFLLIDTAFIPGEMRGNVLVCEPHADGAGFRAILQVTLADEEDSPQASAGKRAVTAKLLLPPPEDPLIFLDRFFPGWSGGEAVFVPPPLSQTIPSPRPGRWLHPRNLTILSPHCPLGAGVAASILQGYRAARSLLPHAFTRG